MSDDRDPFLTQLFAEQSEPAQASDFMAQFADRMERDRHIQRAYRIGMIIAGVIASALLAPLIAQGTAAAVGLVATAIVASRQFLNSPMVWLAVSSIAASFLPIVYLGVTRRW